MADEITVVSRVKLINDVLKSDFNPGSLLLTQTTAGIFDSVRSITTTETSVTLTGITTPRVCVLYNLDATNYVEAGTTTADYPFKLRPASMASVFELNAGKTTLYLKANTATCKVRIIVLEQ